MNIIKKIRQPWNKDISFQTTREMEEIHGEIKQATAKYDNLLTEINKMKELVLT